jgi:uncharacterized protein YoxC
MVKLFKKNKKEPENLKDVLSHLKVLEEKVAGLTQSLGLLEKKNIKNIQKVALIRFNPFAESGGDLSFSLAMLDAENNGLVVTSHYTRDNNRVYAKPVKGGISSYALSKEEKEAIKKAME